MTWLFQIVVLQKSPVPSPSVDGNGAEGDVPSGSGESGRYTESLLCTNS